MLNNEIKVCSQLKQPIRHMNLCSGTLNMRLKQILSTYLNDSFPELSVKNEVK